jgi:hypothetical protein
MARRKTAAEARIERITWALLVLIFAVLYVLSDTVSLTIPNWVVPFAGSVILLGSGIYQYSRRWRVSPVTWLGGGLMFIFVMYHFYIDPTHDFIVESLLVTVAVILIGTFAGET